MKLKNKLLIISMTFTLGLSFAEDDLNPNLLQIYSENIENIENIEKVETMTDLFYDGLIVPVVKKRKLSTSIYSQGSGLSLAMARCEAYFSLVSYIESHVVSEQSMHLNSESLTLTTKANIQFIGVHFDTERIDYSLTSEDVDKYSSEILISMESNFGDLKLNCNLKYTTGRGVQSVIRSEVVKYNKHVKYVEIFFKKMNDIGFKENVFRSGNAFGVALQFTIKN